MKTKEEMTKEHEALQNLIKIHYPSGDKQRIYDFKLGFEHGVDCEESRIEELEEKLKIAVKALEFYAEKSNWVTRTGKIGVCPIDTVDREFNKEDYPFAGGKLARETLSKIKGEG